MGKIYVIESGSDACGKATQTSLLCEALSKMGKKVKKVEFPNYKSDSSLFVKKYLNGDFGKKALDVDPYITSTFFALDRYVTYKEEFEKYYLQDYTIIIDRYTTSNMVYQAGKYETEDEKNRFLDWLYDYEFNLYHLPKPDKVFFLNMPFEISYKLMKKRQQKSENKNKMQTDIHENDRSYLQKVYENALFVAKKYGWIDIDCSENGNIKDIKQIHRQIMKYIDN